MDKETVKQIESLIGYRFSDRSILAKALAHASSTEDRIASNERLEFLGDAILDLVICQSLFERFPNYLEGDLTKIKSMLVSRRTCAKLANQLKLHEFLQVAKGMSQSRALKGSLSAAAIESVIAAVYIDGGLESARDFILRIFEPLITIADADEHQENYKSVLQQYAQQHFEVTPIYELLDEKGPAHNKCFETSAIITSRRFKSAWGTNKKEAEQKAAYNALIELGVIKEKPALNAIQ